MFLELGIVHVKYVLMKKIMQLCHYILNENIDSMIVQVRKGDIVDLINMDGQDLEIELTDENIQNRLKIRFLVKSK